MSYKADFAPLAAEVIRRVNPRFGWRILDAIDRLCESPVELSRPFYSSPPGRYQMYETTVEEGLEKYVVRIFFSYAADEETLYLDEILLRRLEP